MAVNIQEILGEELLDHRYTSLFSVGPIHLAFTKVLGSLWLAGAVIVAAMAAAVRGRSRPARLARAGIESVVSYVRGEIEPFFGESSGRYLPYFLTLFFFILTCNLSGLVPYGTTATANISVTAALAACTFFLIWATGIREQGLLSYLAHLVPSGVPKILVPFFFVLEIFGIFVKCFALCMRLFANMIAGHMVALVFLCLLFVLAGTVAHPLLELAPVVVGATVFIKILDVFVGVLQAYIFTLLTAIFSGMAAHPH